ncbi:MAG: GDP-L-fucose synthase [Pseudomonadota bacterium]
MRRVFVAGHRGMVGSALCRRLKRDSRTEVITRDRDVLDLEDASATARFLADTRPDAVYMAAAKVGGIHANDKFPADFITRNLAIQSSLIQGAHAAGINRLLFLGSSCIYPRQAEQPIREEALLTGPLEPTNAPYAVAKIAGIKMCESYNRQHGRDYRSLMPTNLYGPNDNFHPENSHVIPALLRRFHEARESGAPTVTVWGSGRPRREFLHVDDLADACVHVMELDAERYSSQTEAGRYHLNVGTGRDCTIRELSELIAETVGYRGDILFDHTRPDGTPRKRLDVSRLDALGWTSAIPLRTGLKETYAWYTENGPNRD